MGRSTFEGDIYEPTVKYRNGVCAKVDQGRIGTGPADPAAAVPII